MSVSRLPNSVSAKTEKLVLLDSRLKVSDKDDRPVAIGNSKKKGNGDKKALRQKTD